MLEQKLEQKFKRVANYAIIIGTVFFCLIAVEVELRDSNFESAGKVAISALLMVLGMLLLQKRDFKILPFLIPFLVYLFYIGISFIIDSFKYFFNVYLFILAIGATYFSVRNYLALITITQIINLVASIFLLQNYTTGLIWVHFLLQLSASIVLFIAVQLSVHKSNVISNAFASFSALMKVTPSVLILVSKNSKIKYISQSACSNLGIKNVDELIGKDFLELFNEESVKIFFADLAKKQAFYEDFQKITVNEQTKTFNVSVSEMSDNSGNGIFFMLNDVSEIMRLKELAEHDSLMDSLTQIANRRAFDKQISLEWSYALRDKVNISFLMIDIDFFKNYNDTYGHRQGDELLKAAGLIFKRNVKRSTDLAARIGGEEFGVLMYATNSFQANVIAERIRKAVENEIIYTSSGQQTKFTVSIGVCSVIPYSGMEYGYLVEEADKALYKAKQNGRNKVWVADLT